MWPNAAASWRSNAGWNESACTSPRRQLPAQGLPPMKPVRSASARKSGSSDEKGRFEAVSTLVRQGAPLSRALRQLGVTAGAYRRWQLERQASSTLHELWSRNAGLLGTADAVHATLRQAIISGVLKPGDKLGEEYLASEFSVSRTPVREALMRLSAEQLAVRVSRKGLTVRSMSEREVLDFYAIRIVLDGLAAKLAARLASPAEVAQLRWLNEQMSNAKDLTSQHDFSVQFHAALFECSHNRLLQRIGTELLDWQRGFSGSTFADSRRLARAHADHGGIVAAIGARDGDKAEARASAHMRHALKARADKLGLDAAGE